jgi:hypothetical protein
MKFVSPLALRLSGGKRAPFSRERSRPIDLDIAKSVFQVHRIDAAGEVIVRRQLSRARVLGDVEDDAG